MKARKTILRRRRSLLPPGMVNLPFGGGRDSCVMRFFGVACGGEKRGN